MRASIFVICMFFIFVMNFIFILINYYLFVYLFSPPSEGSGEAFYQNPTCRFSVTDFERGVCELS